MISSSIYLFTFKDLLQEVTGGSVNPFTFSLENYASNIGLTSTSFPFAYTDEAKSVFRNILLRNYSEFITSSKYDTLSNEKVEEFNRRFFMILLNTYPKYKMLLDSYKAKETTMLAKINSSSVGSVQFNDTPQSDNSDQGLIGEDYATTYTKTTGESNTDGSSPMERLREIQEHYRSLYDDWAHEWDRLFFHDYAEFKEEE